MFSSSCFQNVYYMIGYYCHLASPPVVLSKISFCPMWENTPQTLDVFMKFCQMEQEKPHKPSFFGLYFWIPAIGYIHLFNIPYQKHTLLKLILIKPEPEGFGDRHCYSKNLLTFHDKMFTG